MTKEDACGLQRIIKAYGEGDIVQYKVDDKWFDCSEGGGLAFDNGIANYRIKPREEIPVEKAGFKPFEDTAELILHYEKHFHTEYPSFYEPLIWVKRKSDDVRQFITGFGETVIQFSPDYTIPLECLFDDYVFLDNSPCGVQIKGQEEEEMLW